MDGMDDIDFFFVCTFIMIDEGAPRAGGIWQGSSSGLEVDF